MNRTLAYFLAFTGMGTLFLATMLFAAVVLGFTPKLGQPASASPSPSASAPAGPIGTIAVMTMNLKFEPSTITVMEPGRYTVELTNHDGIAHDITFADGTVITVEANGTASGEVEIPAGGLTFLCSVPGHADAGMTGSVVIGDDPVPSGSPMAMTPEEMVAVDAAVTAQFPAETTGTGGQLLAPTVLADGTKVFELTASVIQWEVSPGEMVEAWAYNEMVPGPEIRVNVGDRVRIVLHNELPAPTTVHFHGLIVPIEMDGLNAITQDAVLPGDSFTYEFTVRNSGSHMYHSHFMAQRQVPLGLLGSFVVADPADPAVDQDVVMIMNDGPLGYTINGKGFPATAPIVAHRDQLVRIRYMNEGLQIHPMHLHGLTQTVIAKDGYLLEQPYQADTVLVGPGERYDVLVRASELGTWAFHCHILTHVESDEGMFGMVTAFVVTE
jgi:FtsP/CotA-like multicopper oxidase with cupredoxin domain